MSLTSKLTVQTIANYSKTLDLVTGSAPLNYSKVISMASGIGADQSDLIFTDTRTLAASGTEDLDLAGALVDVFGATLTFARLKMIMVTAALTNTNNVNVARAAANGVPVFLAASDGVPVRPGGIFLYAARDATAIAVTAGTGDLLTITNSAAGTSVTYDVVIIGASA